LEDQEPATRLVNTFDPRQDVHRERSHEPNLNRYRVAESLLPSRSSGLTVLELGGGIGEFSRRMGLRGIEVTFVDLSEHNVRKARALGLDAHRLDLNDGLPSFDDGEFDGVVMLEVIEHIVAAEALLADVNRVLKPGGFLILSTPNFAFFVNRLRILRGGLSFDEGYHYRFFTVNALASRLTEAGFAIERPAHTMPAFGLNLVRNRILGRSRVHVPVRPIVAPWLAHTLIVRARKASGLS
jgi:2-polyprenyl-3-methyl-5-hydroxy-6-metoxy-1,4-benzoquinol methylase